MLTKPESCRGCPLSCTPYGSMEGFVPASGTGQNGILVVLEAAGAEEELAGMPTVGKAGQYLWSQLQRVGLNRDDGYLVHNVLSCRPPNNKLTGMPYTQAAIAHCAPNLQATVEQAKATAALAGRTFVIVTLGKFAFRAIMGITDDDPVMHEDYMGYAHWSESYQAWVLAAPHPSFLMQGNHQLTPILQFVFQRASEIAEHGFTYDQPVYLLDPGPSEFQDWVEGYLQALKTDPGLMLSYDIETPYKRGKDESIVVEDDEMPDVDTHILRCSFAYRPGESVSVPWTSAYMGSFERIFGSGGTVLGWNNQGFDDSRVMAYVPFNVTSIDAMLAWHTLNTSLPKGLGFVSAFYSPRSAMWKHLSDSMPAFYNAKDADMALRCWVGIQRDLKENKLWDVFDRHVVQLNAVLSYMSSKGVLMDMEGRQQAEEQLSRHLAGLEGRIQEVVPLEAKTLKVYKKTPASTAGMVQTTAEVFVKVCPQCGATDVVAEHFKSIGKKRLKAGEAEQPCAGLKPVKALLPKTFWAMPEPFKLSNQALQRYQKLLGHAPVVDRKTSRVTFDVKAMKMLQKTYPADLLYAVVGEFRAYQKILGTYIGITEYEEVPVSDTYVLREGERWKDAIQRPSKKK